MLVTLSAFHEREHWRGQSSPQSPRSFWSAPRIEIQKDRGLWGRDCGEVRNDEGLSHHCVCAQLKKETTFAHLRAR